MIQLRSVIHLILCLGLVGQASFAQSVREYRQTNEHSLLTEYVRFLSIPNVAADTPNIRKNADYLVAEMQERGLKPRLLEAADKKVPPVVYGEWMTPGAFGVGR